jgi:hypothetical protein
VITLYRGDDQTRPGLGGPPTRPGQPGVADPGALPGPARQVTSASLGARGRGPGHRPRRRHRAPAGRDGAPHRRGDRGLHRRAGRRRPAGALQLEELMAGVEDERRHVVRDYLPDDGPERATRRWPRSGRCRPSGCSTANGGGHRYSSSTAGIDLESGLQPRGYRLLARIPRLPGAGDRQLVDRYGSLQKVMRATTRTWRSWTGSTPARPSGQGRLGPPGRVQHPRPLQLSGAARVARVASPTAILVSNTPHGCG